jgi:predicted nucleic acid-binding protein
MKPVFADTFFYLARVNRADPAHQRAQRWISQHRVLQVTTAWVITELGDALRKPEWRGSFTQLNINLQLAANVTIIPPSVELLEKGIAFFNRHADKEWPLTDCISFVVMQDLGLTDALTADHHFEQAGFKALLK